MIPTSRGSHKGPAEGTAHVDFVFCWKHQLKQMRSGPGVGHVRQQTQLPLKRTLLSLLALATGKLPAQALVCFKWAGSNALTSSPGLSPFFYLVGLLLESILSPLCT